MWTAGLQLSAWRWKALLRTQWLKGSSTNSLIRRMKLLRNSPIFSWAISVERRYVCTSERRKWGLEEWVSIVGAHKESRMQVAENDVKHRPSRPSLCKTGHGGVYRGIWGASWEVSGCIKVESWHANMEAYHWDPHNSVYLGQKHETPRRLRQIETIIPGTGNSQKGRPSFSAQIISPVFSLWFKIQARLLG